ncbi:TIGR04255 family protein, partial [Pseudomonas sp. K2]
MNERFDNPPLVELVAELRWKNPASLMAMPPGFPAGFSFPGSNDSFEKQLPTVNSAMSAIGYGASERLIPEGFPAPAEAPIVRYRYSARGAVDSGREHLPSTLFQIGTGIFTVNAVKPYKSWDDFAPVVEQGVRILLESQQTKVEGYSLILRYIDAFKKDLTGDASHLQFLTDVFGFKIEVPEILREVSNTGSVALPVMQITVPLAFGSLQLQMAEGEIEGNK